MKQLHTLRTLQILFLMCCILAFTSCKNPVDEYGDTVIRTYKGAQQFGEQVDLKQLQESIKAFHAANGRYPNDLAELGDFAGIKIDHDKYDYNPSTGNISLKK